MLEDDFNDALGKAVRGLGMTPEQLGISHAQLQALLNGQMDEASLKEIAPQLGLDTEKLIHLENYTPVAREPSSLHTFVSPFGHLGVNAFVIETARLLLIFDTGTDATELLQFVNLHSDKEPHLFITHNHPDHVAGLSQFRDATIHSAGQHNGQKLLLDNLEITCLDVAGHASPASAYLLRSDALGVPVCVVGDAIFAGSIGGCQSRSTYQTALANIRKNLLTLPADTILCTGHGPNTTVANELAHNPFF